MTEPTPYIDPVARLREAMAAIVSFIPSTYIGNRWSKVEAALSAVEAEIAALRAKNGQMRQHLARRDHLYDCEKWLKIKGSVGMFKYDNRPCTCGLDTARAAGEG